MKSFEAGLMQMTKRDYELKWKITEEEDKPELHPFNLEHLSSAFFIKACGLWLGLFVFAYEVKTFDTKSVANVMNMYVMMPCAGCPHQV